MIALDSSVLIDDAAHGEQSLITLQGAMERDDVVICEIVLAEITARLTPEDKLVDALTELGINFSPTNEQSAIRAGIMQRRYRERGGGRERLIADFLVGAHALMQAGTLLTRDAGFYRDYFKGLKIINPVV